MTPNDDDDVNSGTRPGFELSARSVAVVTSCFVAAGAGEPTFIVPHSTFPARSIVRTFCVCFDCEYFFVLYLSVGFYIHYELNTYIVVPTIKER